MTLVEMAIAMGVFMLFMAMATGTIVTIVTNSTSLSERTQAIDELQLAEQNVVRDIHAATTWCSGQSFAAPETELKFVASLSGSTPSFDIKITGNQLEIAENTTGACTWTTYSTLVYNLDPSTTGAHGSMFTIAPAATWTGGGHTPAVTYTYYTAVNVSLTVDSPKPGAANEVQTTVGDNEEVWNQEYACQASWASDPPNPVGNNPC